MEVNILLIQKLVFLLMVTWIIPVSCVDGEIGMWAESNNYFGCALHEKLEKDPSGNLFFSPLSLSVAFGMLFQGARGHTSKEMKEVLYKDWSFTDRNAVSRATKAFLKEATSADFELKIANKILLKDSFDVDPSYSQDMKTYYETEVDRVNFDTDSAGIPQRVNSWVNTHTNGKIQNLIGWIDPDTVMMVLNAVYFKGKWRKRFHEASTSVKPFYNGGYHESPVIMMNRQTDFRYAAHPTYQSVELPYQGDASMVIFLPKERDGLAALESTICSSKDLYFKLLSDLETTNVNLTLPKFSLTYSASLEDPLQSLGMQQVFEYGADLSGISKYQGLKLSRVVHKATVSVDEEGTVATAATGGFGIAASGRVPQEPVQFNVDHPFLFAIMKMETRMVMFMGRVNSL